MSRIKVGGTWKGPNNILVKVSSSWKEVSESFFKVEGVWKRVMSLVPNVIGQTRTNANLAITNLGLIVGTQTATNTGDSAINQQIINTNPVAGIPLDAGSLVNYNYYQYVAPPFFPPFFPFFPFFPPFFPFFAPEQVTCRVNFNDIVYGSMCNCSNGTFCYFGSCGGELC